MIVARGRYLYQLDGVEQDLQESFEVSMADGLVTVVGVRRSDENGLVLEASASYGVQSLIHAEISMSVGDAPTRRASYELLGDEVVVRRGRRSQAVFVPDGAEVFPIMRVFQGRVVARAVAAGTAGLTVVVPDIRPSTDGDDMLAPLVDVRSASLRPDGAYDYVGGSYDTAAAVVTLAEGGLMRAFTWEQEGVGSWRVALADVEGDVRPLEW